MREAILCPKRGHFFMSSYDLTRLFISVTLVFIIVIFAVVKFWPKNNRITTKFITKTAIFTALSIILYTVPYLKFPVGFFPSFLELHFDEVPALIAGFAYGPLSGFFVILVKTIVKLPLTNTAGVGELADFIYSLLFVIPAAIIYRKRRKFVGAFTGLGIATILQVLSASLLTAFVILDLYIKMMPGITYEGLCKMCNLPELGWSFVLYIGIPFNLFKDVIVVVITLILYKRLHRLIDRI